MAAAKSTKRANNFQDLTGQTFNRLTVIELHSTEGRTCWRCRCNCGREVIAFAGHLKAGKVSSCGCARNLFRIAVGDVFGRLTVIEAADIRHRKQYWVCQCQCGKRCTVRGSALGTGNSTSCGCLVADNLRKIATTHGMSDTLEYQTWCGMIRRCTDPKDRRYAKYGGRGIKVCERWLGSFESFYADMGPKPDHGHRKSSIERIDNDGNYCPENCRWVTSNKEQGRNKTTNHKLTHDGRTATLQEWSEITGIPRTAILARIQRGWDHSRALTTPSVNTKKAKAKALAKALAP